MSAGREGHSCLHWVTLLVGWQQLLRNCCSPRKQEKKAPVQEGQRDPDSRSERQDSAKKGTERKRFVFSNAAQCPELGRHSNVFKALLYLLSAEYLLHP